MDDDQTCKHCGGAIAVRNPTGGCDHLLWPDNLTDDAKRANGFAPRLVTVWNKIPGHDGKGAETAESSGGRAAVSGVNGLDDF